MTKGQWSVSFHIQNGEQLEFKFIHDDWITKLEDDHGNIINNYTL